jgi:hypothetical protein
VNDLWAVSEGGGVFSPCPQSVEVQTAIATHMTAAELTYMLTAPVVYASADCNDWNGGIQCSSKFEGMICPSTCPNPWTDSGTAPGALNGKQMTCQCTAAADGGFNWEQMRSTQFCTCQAGGACTSSGKHLNWRELFEPHRHMCNLD